MAAATAPNGIIKSFATRRLMAEWRDYSLSPSSLKHRINIQPLESNIFEWHGNLAPPDEHPYYSGCIFHFVFYFPEDYPKHPPSIELKTGFAHSNIIPNRWHEGRQTYFLCMDVINNFFWQQDSGQNEYRGWSSAYSVETLLLQLYTFLFEERVENYDGRTKLTLYQKPPELGDGKYSHAEILDNLSQSWQECQDFTCIGCGHTYLAPQPVVYSSQYKSIDDLKIRAPLGQLKLQIKPNTINWKQDCHDCATTAAFFIWELRKIKVESIVDTTQINTIINFVKPIHNSDVGYVSLLSNNIHHIMTSKTKDYLTALTQLVTNNTTPDLLGLLTKDYPLIAGYFFNSYQSNGYLDKNINNVNHKILSGAILEATFPTTRCPVFGFCQPSYESFLTTPDLVKWLTNYFFTDGARFLNDFLVIYRNVFPNKTKYWHELVGFVPSEKLEEIALPFAVVKCSYKPPMSDEVITGEKQIRARELLQKLANLLAQALLTPNRYILNKWSRAMDELWELLDINQDINHEIARMISLVPQQRTAKSNSGCPYTCKTCWPNGAPKLDNNAEYQLPFTDPANLMTYCKSFLHPGVFHLAKIRRPENLETLRNLYKLWLTKYSEDILDQLQGWGYDYRGRQLGVPTEHRQLVSNNKCVETGITPKLELSETALRTVLDALPTDSRLLLASASPQFARMLATPEYRELSWLKCWSTGATPTTDVLGYPIMITPFKSRGPESTCIKEISSTLDVISYTAYKDLEINRTVWNMEFGFFIPLYITPNHFEKARECLMKSVSAIYFGRGRGDKPAPDNLTQPPAVIINDIFATLLNSLIVEMMRGETHISMKALEGFTQLFRTWYHLAQDDPEIRKQATKSLVDFQTKTQSRHKRITPNLGRLLMMICIAPDEFTWDSIRDAYIEESRDRNILWILRACPEIIQAKYWTDIIPELPKVLEATLVGKRLQVFNKYFTELVKKPGFLDELDVTYGYPSETIKTEFQQVMKQIYGMNTWEEYYHLTGQQTLKESELARQIYWDTRTSTRKGYNIGIKGVSVVLGNDLELLKLFESNHTLEEITEFFKNFRSANPSQNNTIPETAIQITH